MSTTWGIVVLVLLHCVVNANSVQLIARFLPNEIIGLQADQSTTVTVDFTLGEGTNKSSCDINQHLTFNARCSESKICSVTPEQFDLYSVYDSTAQLCHLRPVSNGSTDNVTLEVSGLFLGRTQLIMEAENQSFGNLPIEYRGPEAGFPVVVYRSKTGRGLSLIFTLALTIIFIVNNFFMGTQLDVNVLKKVFTVPVGPAIGFCCQYVLMPLVAFGFGSLLLAGQSSLQFGYMALGCAPGGGQSNMWTVLLDGNMDLSMTMTFFSSVAALAMMPFWMYTLGATFYSGQINIPFLGMIGSVATLIAPAIIGLLYIIKRPKHRELCGVILKLYTLTTVLIITVFGTLANLYVFELVTLTTAATGLLLPWTGYSVSYLIAFLLRLNRRDCITIAIETGIQSASIAVILCKFTLPEPDSDLTMVMPLCVLIFTYVPMWLLLVYLTGRRHCCGVAATTPPPPPLPTAIALTNPATESTLTNGQLRDRRLSHDEDTGTLPNSTHQMVVK